MLDNFRNRMKYIGENQSQAYLHNADMVINNTFKRDPAYREVIITHVPSNIIQQKYDAKFSIHTRRSIAGDFEDYYLSFRPHVRVPIGAYVDIPDDEGVLQKWLIVLKDDKPQFPMYYVLKCNWTLKWVIGDKVYKVLGCLRNQNSYNSGLWQDNVFESVENQNKFWMPTTPYTQMIEYGQRFVINDPGRTMPITWKCSKVEDVQPIGLTRLTFTQEAANLHEDCSKYGLAGWCPCIDHGIEKPEACKICMLEEPTYIDAGLEMPTESTSGRIVYAGKNATMRVGGQGKTFTSEFWDSMGREFISEEVTWKVAFMNGSDIICSVDLHYNNVWNIVASSGSPPFSIDVINGSGAQRNIKCVTDSVGTLEFSVEPSEQNWRAITIKLPKIYNMVGKKMVISSYDKNNNYTEEIIMEVIS